MLLQVSRVVPADRNLMLLSAHVGKMNPKVEQKNKQDLVE